jgi:hypothetical protein
MKRQTSPQEHINKLNEFRQAIYTNALKKRRDAQFELIDAMLTHPQIQSFPELSLATAFRRQWSSAYKAVEEGSQDRVWLTRHLSQQVPGGVQVFALDETVWPHPKADTLEELLYERSPTRSIKRYSIVKGHVYAILAWVPEAGSSWAPPIDSQRVTAEVNAIKTGKQQIDALMEARRAAGQDDLIVVATDGKYSNHECNRVFADREGLAKVGRMRCDRTLYRKPGAYAGLGTRKRKHGTPFKFKAPDTWGLPLEEVTFEDQGFGTVRLRFWNELHAKQDAEVDFAVIRCEVHLEREKPPKPLWLEYLGPEGHSTKAIWAWFQRRYPIEPQNRFRKQYLNWLTPRFQTTARCDRWTVLVDIAYWQLFLLRDWVQDHPLPWQPAQTNPTPERVLQSLGAHFQHLCTPTKPPLTRGNSPGWPPGRPRTPPERFPAVKRSPKSA